MPDEAKASTIDVGPHFSQLIGMIVLYALTIFLSAFLLFQVQLILAKQLLPWFGGTPTVWTTCQLFFQIVLLAGYSYAHYLARRKSLRRQGWIHIGVLLCAGAALTATSLWSGVPLLAPEALRPSGEEVPIVLLLLILTSTIGLPFFVLSSTGPLLQHWHSRNVDSLDRTYRLYAISNAGSLIGLMSYPFGVERVLDLEQQAGVWAGLFAIYLAGCGLLGWRVSRANQQTEISVNSRMHAGANKPTDASRMPTTLRPWFWFLLSFCGSAMFLATTNQLSLEVASAPFLWVLPLSLYLLTFIVSFDRPKWYSRRWTVLAAAGVTTWVLTLSVIWPAMPVRDGVLVYGLFLALFCWVCHGELARLRPDASRLTQFYLVIAVGGVAGGAFVGLIAPALFVSVWEFHTVALFGWIVLGIAWLADRDSMLHTGDRWHSTLFAGILFTLCVYFFIVYTDLRTTPLVTRFDWRVPLVAGGLLALLSSVAFWRSRLIDRPIWSRGLVLLVIAIAANSLQQGVQRATAGNEFAARDFYGVVRIRVERSATGQQAKVLMDGNTIHGVQVLTADLRNIPTAYYAPHTGIAASVRYLRRTTTKVDGTASRPISMGILGMGAGALTGFAQSGDRVRYYELNPQVIELSQGLEPHFTFVRDSAAQVEIVVGDGRLSLERELINGSPQGFDLLVMDAFSSDAVPVHLLTADAFRTYVSHLRDDNSIIAVNISNRHLDLEPVVAASARRLGLRGVRVDAAAVPPVPLASSWILLARNPYLFYDPHIAAVKPRPLQDREVLFTDRYSNLLRVLK